MRMKVEFVAVTEAVFENLEAFRSQHPSARIVSVDGRMCYGECSSCGSLILGNDRYMMWPDGKMSCANCGR